MAGGEAAPLYLIHVDGQTMSARVHEDERAFLLEQVLPALAPLDEQTYRSGPIALSAAGAVSSYVLVGDQLLWLVARPFGLIAIRFSPDGSLAAVRIPRADDADHDPAHHIVYDPWDAEHGGERLEQGFRRAPAAVRRRRDAAIARANQLGAEIEQRMAAGSRDERRAFIAACVDAPFCRGK